MQLLGGISQGDLSRASGVSPTTISLFLRGKRELSMTALDPGKDPSRGL